MNLQARSCFIILILLSLSNIPTNLEGDVHLRNDIAPKTSKTVSRLSFDGEGTGILFYNTSDCTAIGNSIVSQPQLSVGYLSHEGIMISSNADFLNQDWPGSGTESDPYVISGLHLDNTMGIEIENTDSYFVIQNCLIEGFSFAGIFLESLKNGFVENCTIFNPENGFEIYYSNDSRIISNKVYDINQGILLSDSKNCTVSSNSITNSNSGVRSWRSRLINYYNNTFDACIGTSLWSVGDEECMIYENNFLHSGYLVPITNMPLPNQPYTGPEYSKAGVVVLLEGTSKAMFRNNRIFNNMNSSITCRITECSEILILENLMHNNYGPLIIIESSGIDLVSNHISTVVEYESSMNCSLVENELDQGIYFEGSAANLFGIVDGNVVEESNLVLYDSLSSMTIDCNLIAQAIVLNCTNLNFTGGVFSTPFGIFVESSINCVFEDGSYLRNVYSIHVRNTTHCQFLNNTIHNSNLGFNILEVTSCDFVSNRISDSLTGMRVDSSHDCLFILNIFDNLHIGVYLTETTSHNALYSNVFDFSTQHKALDDGTENSFDNEAGIGNSWGDYLGFGVYAIPGDSGSIDHYPSPGIVGILTITAAIGSIIVILLLVIRKIVSNRGHLQ